MDALITGCMYLLQCMHSQEPPRFDKFAHIDYASETCDSMLAFDGSQQYQPFEVAWVSGELTNNRGLRDVVPQPDAQTRVNHRVLDLVDWTKVQNPRDSTMFRTLFPRFADGTDDDETQHATDDELCARGMIPQDIMYSVLLELCPSPFGTTSVVPASCACIMQRMQCMRTYALAMLAACCCIWAPPLN